MKIVKRALSKPLKTPHGSLIYPLIDSSTSDITGCSLAEEVLPPGLAVQPHYHETHEEVYYLLSGAGRMRVGEEWQDVAAGDAIYIPINHIHSLHNTGDEDIKLILVVGPAFSFDDVRTVS